MPLILEPYILYFSFLSLLCLFKLLFVRLNQRTKSLLGFFERLHFNAPVEIWDKSAQKIQSINGIPVVTPTEELITGSRGAYVVITIQNRFAADAVKDYFEAKGIHTIHYSELLKWFAYRIWKTVDEEAEG